MTAMITSTDAGRRDGSLLTPDDTYVAYIDSLSLATGWATTTTVRLDGDPYDQDNPVTAWEVVAADDDDPAVKVTLRHADIVAAMLRIATDRTLDISRRVVAGVQSVLDAPTHDDLVDAMCQLDEIGFNAILRVAVLGDAAYPREAVAR